VTNQQHVTGGEHEGVGLSLEDQTPMQMKNSVPDHDLSHLERRPCGERVAALEGDGLEV
jgi:hypothetical protein